MAVMVAEPQHETALRLANRVRLARAELKRRIARGELSAADVLRDPPVEAHNMEVLELLMAQKRWGRHRSLRLLRIADPESPMSEQRTLGQATARQRTNLAHLLERR